MKTNLSRASFEEKKNLEPKSRLEARQSSQPIFRGTLPTTKTSLEAVEAIWAKNTSWIEL